MNIQAPVLDVDLYKTLLFIVKNHDFFFLNVENYVRKEIYEDFLEKFEN